MVAMFEQELRDFANNPAEAFSPTLSWTFLAQRLVSILFWFILSLALTTIAPGAISRAVARFQLSPLKIFAIGFFGFVVTIFGVIAGLKFCQLNDARIGYFGLRIRSCFFANDGRKNFAKEDFTRRTTIRNICLAYRRSFLDCFTFDSIYLDNRAFDTFFRQHRFGSYGTHVK